MANTDAWSTIHAHPDLFAIVTPVNVDVFESMLEGHPNRALVDSVVVGLREGFWPFADADGMDLPSSWDEEGSPLSREAEAFVENYAQEEERAGRYSAPFGPQLLGNSMYCMPLFAIPKPNTDIMRVINNHSAGNFSLNSMIAKACVGMRQDNVQDLGKNLIHFRQENGSTPLWMFKSDVSHAYRLLPMHPLWQLKQVVTVGGLRRIDRCSCFGNRGSADLWCTFHGLVVWIAINVRFILELLAYMDDNFGFDANPDLVFYSPYHRLMPSKQFRLLTLWDDLGIPHSDNKQLFGRALEIIGFFVDPRSMSVTMPADSSADLVEHIRAFLAVSTRQQPLREWQRLLGWINWGLNVHPLLKPGLQSSYRKIAGKSIARAPIYLNARVVRDLTWVANMFESNEGIFFYRAKAWPPRAADLTILCDASLEGLGYWCPLRQQAFMADRPPAPVALEDHIFWYEALCVLGALEWAASLPRPPQRLAIYTDNLNTVQMFDSFRASEGYDDILLRACEILLLHQIDLRVWHIPGAQNTIADALSRHLLQIVQQYRPDLVIYSFEPPHVTLGAAQK